MRKYENPVPFSPFVSKEDGGVTSLYSITDISNIKDLRLTKMITIKDALDC